jgi:hypothetical protein
MSNDDRVVPKPKDEIVEKPPVQLDAWLFALLVIHIYQTRWQLRPHAAYLWAGAIRRADSEGGLAGIGADEE